jgi:hypothetical protein
MNSMSYSPTGVFATHSGPKIAAIASIVQTCRRLDVNLRDYLRDVLPKLGEWPISRVGELTRTHGKPRKPRKPDILAFYPPRTCRPKRS